MKKLIAFFLCSSIIFACSKQSNDHNFQFAGNWQGTYSGNDDHGTWKVDIDQNGIAKGSATSLVISETFQLTGTETDQGLIALTFGTATSGGSFTGTINGDKASGTWENKITNPIFSGTWSGKKN
jgi:hypothetical protein